MHQTDVMELPELRTSYELATLDISDAASNPYDQMTSWIQAAMDAEVPEPHAMAVSTVGGDGTPSSRNVLLRGVSTHPPGLVFYTNQTSQKAEELVVHPIACALFSWLGLQRQIRATGQVVMVDASEADAYFATRPRGSQIGAWTSDQSKPIESRQALEARWAEAEATFEGKPVPRPPHWGGYRILATEFEFWQGRKFRMHDRLRYRRNDEGWTIERLAP